MNFIESCCRKKLILFNLEKFQNSPSIVLDDAEWEDFLLLFNALLFHIWK